MHSWEKRDVVLICQGASRVQVHAGVPLAPERKKMKHIHMRLRENQRGEAGGGACEQGSQIENSEIVMHDLVFKRRMTHNFY